MYNLFVFMRAEGIDAAELSRALTKVIKNHPALMTVLERDEHGNIMQRYAPELMEEIKAEKVSEDELMVMKDYLVQPFEMLGHHLYRCRVFATESASYFFLDIHHIICDGFSTRVLSEDISRVLSGEELEKDY